MRFPLMPKLPLVAVAVAATLAAAPAAADTLASSAIFNSFSASVGSISTSFNASSDASSPGRPLRTGEYRVLQIAAAPGREGYARLTLRAQAPVALSASGSISGAQAEMADAAATVDDVHLFLPHETVARAALAEGQVIRARARPYGLELAKAAAPELAAQPFFLVVADEWLDDLQTRAVKL